MLRDNCAVLQIVLLIVNRPFQAVHGQFLDSPLSIAPVSALFVIFAIFTI